MSWSPDDPGVHDAQASSSLQQANAIEPQANEIEQAEYRLRRVRLASAIATSLLTLALGATALFFMIRASSPSKVLSEGSTISYAWRTVIVFGVIATGVGIIVTFLSWWLEQNVASRADGDGVPRSRWAG